MAKPPPAATHPTPRTWALQAVEKLAQADVPFAPRVATLLLAEALEIAPPQVAMHADEPLAPEAQKRLEAWLAQRLERVPLEYCTGWAWFNGMRFAVTPDVLIPRQSTEFLLERAIACIDPDAGPIVDVGTGSGILAISLARRFPELEIIAVDVSPQALAIAQENARRLLPPETFVRMRFLQSDLLAAVEGPLQGIVANLPYIPTDEIDALEPEVRCEPFVALNGGRHGITLIEQLLEQAKGRAGWLALEIGDEQAETVKRLCTEGGWPLIQTVPDLVEMPRIVIARK